MKKADLKSLEHWIDQAEGFREHLSRMLDYGAPGQIETASKLHLYFVTELAAEVREILRRKTNPLGPRVSLELMEREFILLRELAERNLVLEKKMERRGASGRQRTRARKAFEKSAGAARSFATSMKEEMVRRGIWSEDLGAELGMSPWL